MKKFTLLVFVCGFLVAYSGCVFAGGGLTNVVKNINKEGAMGCVSAAEEKAKELGASMVIAVVDNSGVPVALVRMDGARPFIVDVALSKAYTPASTGFPSSAAIADMVQPGQALFGLHSMTGGKLTVFGGGVMLKDKDGNAVGAIGVSGSSVENDVLCAEAGAKWLAGQ